MAKNLKLKVKNVQLAKAIKLKKEKSEKAEKVKEKKEAKKAKILEDSTTKVKKTEAAPVKKPEALPPKVQEKSASADIKPSPEKVLAKEPLADSIQKPVVEKKVVATEKTKPAPGKKEVKETKAQEKPKFASNENKSFPAKQDKDFKKRSTLKSSYEPRKKQFSNGDDNAPWKRKKSPYKYKNLRSPKTVIEIVRPKSIEVRVPITIKDLASEMKLKASEIISKLFLQGITLTINDYLEDETMIQLIGHDFDCEITLDKSEEKRLMITEKSIAEEIAESDEKDLVHKAPTITFMGHVDHGKTSLIDVIRKSDIVAGESGAITQHIGAFKCHQEHGDLTIIDTPGHEAFTIMRKRGVSITDVAVLVIAGDEGMKPQTIEAMNQAKASNVPTIVAINKCDKEGFDIDNVYRQLADNELLPESWGGTTITVKCSAATGEGIKDLIEMLILQSEILELKANPKSRARGSVIESQLHKGFGPVATVLVQNGTLNIGDAVVIDHIYGRIKTLHDEYGESLTSAGPSTPVKITGLSGVPEAGSEFIAVESEKVARKLTQDRESGHKRALLKQTKLDGMEALFQKHTEKSERKSLNLIIRADVQGSVEAVKESIFKLPQDKVEITIVSADVGEISESDVELAMASNAIILGFHTQVESHAEGIIKQSKTVISLHEVIYHLINEVKSHMEETLDKIRVETLSGSARVQEVFKSSKLGLIAGCIVTSGTLKRNQLYRVMRGSEKVWEGGVASLKRVKEDVKEITKGLECGILLNNFSDLQPEDEIESYDVTFVKQKL